MFTLGVRDTPASSVEHPLFPLCVCSEIVTNNPSELSSSYIRFHPPSFQYSYVKHPCNILPLSILFRFVFANFRQFCRFLERIKTNDNPETLVVRFVLFAYALVHRSVGPGLKYVRGHNKLIIKRM